VVNVKIEDSLDEYKIRGYEVILKKVTPAGSSGKIYLPVGWVGKRVKIIRIDR
jgi:putative transposon-encoded protein